MIKNHVPGAILLVVLLAACGSSNKKGDVQSNTRPIGGLFKRYFDGYEKLFPLLATSNGDNRYNDIFPNDLTQAYRDSAKHFFSSYLDSLKSYDHNSLSAEDQLDYDVLQWDCTMYLESYQYHDYLFPITQYWSTTISFAQLGSGNGDQPFKTVKDYKNFLGRVNGFSIWCDSAIANMRKGVKLGYTSPKVIMERVLPELQALIVTDVSKSAFYGPISSMPDSFSAENKKMLEENYRKAIAEQIVPAYQKLYTFIKDEYMPQCRTTSGIGDLPDGKEYYNYLIKMYTTTDMTADEIFDLGNKEVQRIRGEMEKVKNETGFKGSLNEFFTYLESDKRFYPFTTGEEVVDSFRHIYDRIKPALAKLFDVTPTIPFEIRETEKYREASASPEYYQGTADGKRPGIFYVPAPDPSKYSALEMEALFLHEAIPGHHYQISLQIENTHAPEFIKHDFFGAYMEGWALYTESLGKDLGLYKSPYLYFASLNKEMHRAIRLVVDVGIHAKGWTREQAIQFSLDNEMTSKEVAAEEVERYMATPGQALGYKIGQMRILEMRDKAQKELGSKFNIAKFHDAVLDNGSMPMEVLENKIDLWIEETKKAW